MLGATLDWISGISWALVYLLAIIHGFRKKTHCIPAVCICLNFGWEMWAVLVRVLNHSLMDSGFISQLLWMILDIGVLYTWFRYTSGTTLGEKVILLVGAVVIMAAATLWAGLWEETAFAINLVMSVAFMVHFDKEIPGIFSIAILKCIGTLPATILNGLMIRNFFSLTIGGLCLISDLCYVDELWKKRKPELSNGE